MTYNWTQWSLFNLQYYRPPVEYHNFVLQSANWRVIYSGIVHTSLLVMSIRVQLLWNSTHVKTHCARKYHRLWEIFYSQFFSLTIHRYHLEIRSWSIQVSIEFSHSYWHSSFSIFEWAHLYKTRRIMLLHMLYMLLLNVILRDSVLKYSSIKSASKRSTSRCLFPGDRKFNFVTHENSFDASKKSLTLLRHSHDIISGTVL